MNTYNSYIDAEEEKCRLFPEQLEALSDSLTNIYWGDIRKNTAMYHVYILFYPSITVSNLASLNFGLHI